VRKPNGEQAGSGARIAELEAKLDGLVSLLQTVARSSDSSAALKRALDNDGIASASVSTSGGQGDRGGKVRNRSQDQSQEQGQGQSEKQDRAGSGLPTSTLVPILIPTPVSPWSDSPYYTASLPQVDSPPITDAGAEAETSLQIFRSRMLQDFAIMHLAPDLTAHLLRQDRPFVLRAIIAVTSTSAKQKIARGKELKRDLAQAVVVENQSSIDLLLGLLIYISWGHDQFLMGSCTLSRLMIMAMSIVCDLRLDKPVPPDVHMLGHYTGYEGCYGDGSEATLERQRAVLGCFLLSSL
jgi:hypothetical protein